MFSISQNMTYKDKRSTTIYLPFNNTNFLIFLENLNHDKRGNYGYKYIESILLGWIAQISITIAICNVSNFGTVINHILHTVATTSCDLGIYNVIRNEISISNIPLFLIISLNSSNDIRSPFIYLIWYTRTE